MTISLGQMSLESVLLFCFTTFTIVSELVRLVRQLPSISSSHCCLSTFNSSLAIAATCSLHAVST